MFYKKIIFLLIIFLLQAITTGFASEQPVCDGALDLTWNDSAEKVKEIAKNNKYELLEDFVYEDANIIQYNGFVANLKARIKFYLINNKLHTIAFIFSNNPPTPSEKMMYEILRSHLIKKYDQPKIDLKIGSAYWLLPTSNGEKAEINLHGNVDFSLVYSLYRSPFKGL
jgi:hypothetical protein